MKTGGMDFANIVHEINPAFPRTLLAAVPRPAQIFFRIIALPSADMHHCKGVQQSDNIQVYTPRLVNSFQLHGYIHPLR